jgi:LmbE family N-acetylglucosaminyl deacetylase
MGTPEESWLAALASVQVWQPPLKPTLLVSPHPDDETLGAGSLIAAQRRRGVEVRVVAVTDGEAAYADAFNLAEIRRAEQQAALKELGVSSGKITRLGLPDSAVSSREEELTAAVASLVSRGTLLLAPWICDPHPDHEACGRAARRVAESTGCEAD